MEGLLDWEDLTKSSMHVRQKLCIEYGFSKKEEKRND